MTNYFAHSVPEQPEERWEPLVAHLADVAARARVHGDRFGAGELAARAGWLHDLGKYKGSFQARLRGSREKVDHAAAGANFALARYGKVAGGILAHVIAGHHAGLKDELFAPEGRLKRALPELAPVEQAARSDGLNLAAGDAQLAGFKTSAGEEGFQFAFLTRMLFSCLIDADRMAAATFEAAAAGTELARESAAPIAALESRLADFVASRHPTAAARPINRLRDQVREDAVAHAEDAQGVFTLTVPTGGGKTLTSLAFALAHARHHQLDRVVVVIPFTSVIEQTAQVYREALGDLAGQVLEHHSAFDMETELRRERIGPDALRLTMERWDRPIVVTTAVQFFESLFSNRPSRCRKLHSLARSVVVLDEVQTLPLKLLRPCVAALKELARNYATSVVLCTATQPALTAGEAGSQTGFAGGFVRPTELVADVPRLFAALRRVVVRNIGEQTDAALAERMRAYPQVLCIVNQRAHARELFGSIRDLAGGRHLSTCMHAVHRSRVLAEIKADLREGKPCRVVSTSLVEAGVDVDFPLVLRAEAGLDQVAQAAGRCNREGRHVAEASEVLLFKAPDHGVLQALRTNAEVAAEMLRLHEADPLGPPAIAAYFNMLYWRRGRQELDANGVLERCGAEARKLDFPFESISESMRFIEDTMVPIIVPAEDHGGEALALLETLRFVDRPGGIARRLQRYVVGIPRRIRAKLLADGLAETIRQHDFADQFVRLLHLDLYRPDVGLHWSDPSFIVADRLMVC